ncbi:MAG: Lrp/AsnC family transcriptional regulator [Candidatus Ranarchaeia archaeon]|jgi:Lrp/AsnC family leucine-responsive transcriptional regulator
MKLSSNDQRILELLRQDGRMSLQDIARSIGVSTSAISQRIKTLQKKGVIQGFTALVSEEYSEKQLCNLCILVNVDPGKDPAQVGEAIAQLSEVCRVHYITGNVELALEARCADPENASNFLNKLRQIPGVHDFQAHSVLKTIKNIEHV